MGFADRINALPKYVVSKTLKDVEWENSTLLSGDIVDDVRGLKEQPGGDILTSGSADLVDTLMEHDLIDEYRIAVYPVVLGSGKHLFRQRAGIVHMRLRETRTFASGIVLLSYEPARETPTTATWTRSRGRRSRSARWMLPRTWIASWRPSCSPTSWIPPGKPRPWAIANGGSSWTVTTGRSGRRWSGSTAVW